MHSGRAVQVVSGDDKGWEGGSQSSVTGGDKQTEGLVVLLCTGRSGKATSDTNNEEAPGPWSWGKGSRVGGELCKGPEAGATLGYSWHRKGKHCLIRNCENGDRSFQKPLWAMARSWDFILN